jgi:hypothetical protein
MARKSLLIVAILSVMASFLISRNIARAALVVTPSVLQGWNIFPAGTAPSVAAFQNGAGTPPLGAGSYRGEITGSNSKILLGRGDYHLTALSGLAISYSTYRDAASTNNNDWYVNVYVDTNNDLIANCRLDFATSTGPSGSWTGKNATGATTGWYVNNSGQGCPTTASNIAWSAVLAGLPGTARVLNPFTGNVYPGIVFNMGDTGSSYVGYRGNIDNITVNGTNWDFELTPPVAGSAAPSFFNPGDCRIDPKPWDKLAICCEASRLVVYAVRPDSRGFFISYFDYADLKEVGLSGIYNDRGIDGVISASVDEQDNFWVAWNGGQYNANGQPKDGYAKGFTCPTGQ